MAEPRASTDEGLSTRFPSETRDCLTSLLESAPLLNSQTHATTASAFSRPKTTREKALASIAVFFLLLASLFIGLFAGAEASFKKEKGKHNSGGGGGPGWGTVTETKTDTQTETATATTTHIGQPTGTPAPVRLQVSSILCADADFS